MEYLPQVERLAQINAAGVLVLLGEPMRQERQAIVDTLVSLNVIELQNHVSKGGFRFLKEEYKAEYLDAFKNF